MKHVQSFESFLNEEMINEIGDSSSQPFSWKAVTNIDSWLRKCEAGAKDKSFSGSTEDRYYKMKGSYRYEFDSDSSKKTGYFVEIQSWVGRDMYLSFGDDSDKTSKNQPDYHLICGLSFGIRMIGGDPETNLNEHFRVMATVVECAVDFIQKIQSNSKFRIQEMYMDPKLDNSDQRGIDSRRGKLYLAFIQNSLQKVRSKIKGDFFIQQTKNGFTLKFGTVRYADGSIPAEVVAATFT